MSMCISFCQNLQQNKYICVRQCVNYVMPNDWRYNHSRCQKHPSSPTSAAPSFSHKISCHIVFLLFFVYSQGTVSVTVASASARQTGRARTVTAPDVQTLVCPAWASCAAGGVSACVEPASARNQVPTEPRVTSVPPAPMPVPWRSEFTYRDIQFSPFKSTGGLVDILHFNRECVECKHFKRGKLIEDKTCSRICKDEIVLVDELGEMFVVMITRLVFWHCWLMLIIIP